MQNITVAKNTKTFTLIKKEVGSSGLILIVSTNSNWAEYMMYEILNTFTTNMNTDERKRHIFRLEQEPWVTPAWARPLNSTDDVTGNSIVLAGSLRDVEVATRAIALARSARVVIAIMNTETTDACMQRFTELGIAHEEFKDVLKVMVSLEEE